MNGSFTLIRHQTVNNDEILTVIRGVVEAESRIRFAYLFGSRAGGRTGPLSDYDLAVFVDDRTDIFPFRLSLLERLERETKGAPLDLVVLNAAPPVLKYQVIRTGRVLKEAREIRVPFETRVLREYLDTEYLRRTQHVYLRKQLRRETLHG